MKCRMPDLQCFEDWKASDLRAEEAYRTITAGFAEGQFPTLVQLEEVQRLRSIALDKLREMAQDATEETRNPAA